MRALILALMLAFAAMPALAQSAAEIVAANAAQIAKPSRQTIGPVIAELAASGDAQAAAILEAWEDKRLGLRKADGVIFIVEKAADGWVLTNLAGTAAGRAAKADITELKPNAGVRGLIATALVQFTLSDPDRAKRAAALDSIAQDPTADALEPLAASVATEDDALLKSQKERLVALLTIRFGTDSAARVAASAPPPSRTTLPGRSPSVRNRALRCSTSSASSRSSPIWCWPGKAATTCRRSIS